MNDYAKIAEHFKSDTAKHTITAQREDGLYRHLEFAAPKTSMTRIVLITWPYNLLVAGSHGSFHFERYGQDTEDMFDWLRGSRVNPSSWASKLVNGYNSVREYDRSRLEKTVNERVAEAVRDGWAPDGLKAAVREEILDSDWLGSKDIALQLVDEFEHGVTYRSECSCGVGEDHDSYSSATVWDVLRHRRGEGHKVTVKETGGFRFSDVSEWSIHKLSYHFVYQCHAIVWGIGQYDAARKAVTA